MPDQAGLAGVLVGFARELRAAGLPVGTGDAAAYCAAMTALDPADLADLYWGGRTTLVSRREHVGVYDETFRRYFLGEAGAPAARPLMIRPRTAGAEAMLVIPTAEPGGDAGQDEAVLGWMASDVETLRHKSFAACTPEELAALRRIMARIRLTPPRRRTRRTVPARSGARPDLRRTLRDSMRLHGEPAELRWRRRKTRLRPLIFIVDISGSMADYSRALVQFAYSANRAAGRVEVFCFGTRLSRITRELDTRSPDAALQRAAAAVFDWEGGTRIGDCLAAFVRDHARRGLCRGGIVVICSDGLDRGDPEVLAGAMERLSRLCRTVIWISPHAVAGNEFRPVTVGMIAAAPHIDMVLPGRDLESLEKLAKLLPALS